MPSLFSFKPFRAAAFLWRSRSIPVVPLPNGYPLYQGTPSFIARWALVFISFDVLYMGNMVFECWKGGQLYHNPLKNIRRKQSEDIDSPGPPPLSTSSEKPLWTRLAFGAFHCGLGGFIAAFILSQRSSWIRSMTIVRPRRKAPPQLFIEVASHPKGYGHPFRLQDCSLVNYSDNNNIIMIDTGKEGKFPFYPAGATIGGEKMPLKGDIAKINMLKVWKQLGGTIQQKK